ncbi:DNA binding protein [Peromfec virus RodF8_43]|uniref:DNA binding protein n=1 Tax=Peromfec virus RodF8_43 TaxID=2929376 RepID=A0A976N2E5_9VIRU|nr:DNA binding protein [Peromfec virus RodF8_43]
MAKRSRVRRRKDQRVFTRTASKSKKINVNPKIFRGGIRL